MTRLRPHLSSTLTPLLLTPLSLLFLLLLGGCGAVDGAGPRSDAAPSSQAERTTATSPSISTTTPSTTIATSTTVAVAVDGGPAASVGGGPACRTVADLEDPEELRRWQVVNDGVMGGRSSAQAEVGDSNLTFAGEIVTDGGGFSSVRLALDEPLGDVSRVTLRVRTDGRRYELTASDAAPGRDRRVAHQGPIPAVGEDGWEEVVVDLTTLDASVFGRPVDVEPFDPGTAVEIGVILADGRDGPFRFELDWVRICP